MSRKQWFGLLVGLGLMLAVFSTAVAQDNHETVFEGFLDSSVPDKTYPITLEPGQALLLVSEATSGDLDTVVSLYDSTGRLVVQNDDRSDESYDSALGYVSESGGPYKVVIARYPDTDSSGHYTLRMVIGDESVLDELATLTRVQLSGPMLVYESPNFRIHYTMEGQDAALSTDYVAFVAQVAEEAWQAEVKDMNWPVPPDDGILGGDGRFDIYVKDLLGAGEEALGFAVPDVVIGDNPNTVEIETGAAGSYLVVENDFADEGSGGSPFGLLRTTVAHELNHALQFGFDANDTHNWVYEATATWMETVVAGKDQDATGYVIDAFNYPELCFGTVNDPDSGAVQYGEWPFLQLMTDDLGPDAVLHYWENIAIYDGWESLAQTLAPSGETVPDFVARYRIKNLARDYSLAPLFDATVWLENTITDTGRWTFTGQGIQELGANYFRFNPRPGLYYAGLVNDDGQLQLWAVGVTGSALNAIPLGRGGVIDTSLYNSVYLVVFNPAYDDDMTDCVYQNYDIDVQVSKSPPSPAVAYQFPATQFEALRESASQSNPGG
ncbi:MAG: MXAN_6640 family putative metalloprotease [Anaerolineae bacterium]